MKPWPNLARACLFWAAVLCLNAAWGQAGYLSVPVAKGYNFLGNPFNATDTNGVLNNSITNVLQYGAPAIPEGTAAYVWNVSRQAFDPAALYSQTSGWSTDYDLPPGKGFALYSTSSWTLTFAGAVPLGSLTNGVPGTNRFALVASKALLLTGGNLSATGLALPNIDGETLYLFGTNSQSFSDAFTWFNGFGWFDPDGMAGTNGPVVAPAEAFFVQHPGADVNWVQTATVHPLISVPAPPGFTSLWLHQGGVVLGGIAPGGNPYSIYFSADGVSWAQVATNRTGPTWSSSCPAGRAGFYRTLSP